MGHVARRAWAMHIGDHPKCPETPWIHTMAMVHFVLAAIVRWTILGFALTMEESYRLEGLLDTSWWLECVAPLTLAGGKHNSGELLALLHQTYLHWYGLGLQVIDMSTGCFQKDWFGPKSAAP